MHRNHKQIQRIVLACLLALSVQSCTIWDNIFAGEDPPDSVRKATEFFLLTVLLFNSQTCESFSDKTIQLQENVSFGPVKNSEDVCFIITTTQPRTINVTTNATEDVNIILWIPSNRNR